MKNNAEYQSIKNSYIGDTKSQRFQSSFRLTGYYLFPAPDFLNKFNIHRLKTISEI